MPHVLTYAAIFTIGLISMIMDPAYAEDTADGTQQSDYSEAQALIEKEKFADALLILEAVTAAQPDNADAWNLRGYANRKLGDFKQAAMAYSTALRLNPGHLGALEYQGEMFVELGQIQAAQENLRALQAICGDCEQAEDLEKSIEKTGS